MNPGPYLPDPIKKPEDMSKLKDKVDVNVELKYVFDALTMTRHALAGEVPLIGFCGSPWTLFAYMIEGGGSKTFQEAKTWLFKYPEESHILLNRVADVCVDFLVGQVKAGAQLLQIFDSWAGDLSPHDFQTFSLPTLERIAARTKALLAENNLPAVPMTVFPKGANQSLAAVAATKYDTISIDWCIEPAEARRIVGDRVALQGNLDPAVLYATKDAIEREVKRMCENFKGGKSAKAWIANLGHGITPGVDPENLRHFFQCVHKYSSAA